MAILLEILFSRSNEKQLS